MPRLMQVLEYLDPSGNTMIMRVPENEPAEIKWGAQLTVRESQEAVFFRDGKALDVFGPGRHVLKTQNIPVIGKWVTSFGYGPDSPFRSEVYFVSKSLFPNLKWGTKEPILFRDSELKMIRLRSFGILSIQIADSMLFLNKVVGTRGIFKNSDIQDYLRNIMIAKLTTLLGETLTSVMDMPSSFNDISLILKTQLQPDFEGLGLSLHDFYVNSISVPEDVQEMIDTRSGMSALGNIDEFMKYKMAMTMEAAASNPGGGMGQSMSAGMGLGMGFMMPQMVQESMKQTAQPQASESSVSSMEKLKKLKELFDLDVLTKEEYDEKKKKLMDMI